MSIRTLLDQQKKGQARTDWKYNKNNLFTMSDEGYGKEGGDLKSLHGVEGKTRAGNGEMQ